MARHFADVAGASCAAQTQSRALEEPVVVRLQPHELDLLDAWMVAQDDIPQNRQAAVCRLIVTVCGKMKGRK
jgi:hypothetical protein